MKHYKSPDNSLHVIEPEFAYMLPAGCVEITEEEAEVIRQSQIAAIPRNIQAEIDSLESSQLMPRATREFMLLSMEAQFTANQLKANPGYKAVKEFDIQIAELRALL